MTKAEFEAQTPEQRHAINPNAKLADIGTIVSEALNHDREGDTFSVSNALLDLHSLIFPNSSYTATPEELATLAAQEPPAKTPCQSGDCDSTCNRCEEGIVLTTTVDAEFVKTIQDTARVLVQASAEIHNALRRINRESDHSNDVVIVSEIQRLSFVAGNLSEQWAELDLTLAMNDMTDI